MLDTTLDLLVCLAPHIWPHALALLRFPPSHGVSF